MPFRTSTPPLSPPPGQQDQSARLAASAEVPGQEGGTIHPEKTGWDKLRDSRFVLAKGAGPGIWNCWESHCGGYRIFWSNVDRGYLA